VKIIVLLASHALVFGAGWLAFRDPGEGSTAAIPAGTSQKDSRRNRDADREEGRRLVKEMRAAWGIQVEAERAADYRAGQKRKAAEPSPGPQDLLSREFEKILKLSSEVVLPADPAAEMKRLKMGDDRALSAFVVAWLRQDAGAALAYLESDVEMHRSKGSLALHLWVRECGPEAVPDLVAGKARLQGLVAGDVLKVAASEDPASLGNLMERMEGWLARDQMLRFAFGSELPAGKREAALDWIKTNLRGREVGNSIMQIAIGMDDKQEAKAFLKGAIAGGLDPAVVEQLKGSGNYGDIMRSGVGPDSPMDERIEALVAGGIDGKTAEEKQANARTRIIGQDVEGWMRDNYLLHSLRSGNMGAGELWNQVEAALPQYAGEAARDLMLRAFIRESAVGDPEGAAELMKKEGKESEIADYFLDSVMSGFYQNEEASIRLAASVPDDALRDKLSGYDRFYESAIPQAASEFGSFWTEWLEKQPAGLNRDLVIHHTAKYLARKGNEPEATRLRELIRDPGIKDRPLR
jgi:hypothetical protein